MDGRLSRFDGLLRAPKVLIKVSFTMAHLFVMKVARLRDRIREECAMYIIMLTVVTLDEQRDDQILGHTENKKHLLVQQGLR